MVLRRQKDPFSIAGSLPNRSFRIQNSNVSEPILESDGSAPVYLTRNLPSYAVRIWLGVIVTAFLLLFARTAYLQLVAGSRMRLLADGNRIRVLDILSPRGKLLDRYGQALVRNEPNLQISVVPIDLPRKPKEQSALAGQLAALLGKPAEEMSAMLEALDERSYQPVTIAEDLRHEQAIQVAVLSSRLPAIRLDESVRRQYITNGAESLSHLLGYLGKIDPGELEQKQSLGYRMNDTIGKAGLELALENELRGRKGREQIEVDATGRQKELIAHEPPVSGDDVYLTIDLEAQRELERVLLDTLRSNGLWRGAAVVMDPRSGEILAQVSLPAYDNNAFARGITSAELDTLVNDVNRPLFNRAIQGTYPPGSTIKPIVAAAGLQEGIINQHTTFLSVGGIRVNQWFFPDWKSGGHGPTNVTFALAESVNTYFYYIGGGYGEFQGLGVDRLDTYLRQAGLGQALGIELVGESAGLVPTPEWKKQTIGEPWYIGDTYHLSIGQGDLLVTPLQIAGVTAVVANGGTLYRPRLVRELRPPNVLTGVLRLPVPVRSAIFSPDSLAIIRLGLRAAVRTGSARSLNTLPIPVAGKTGTAQWSKTANNHAWFTGFAPADDPQIVITVIVEEGGEGSAVAVPVAAKFFMWWENARYTSL